MTATVLYMSMSLDGYIAGPNDEPDNPGGDGFDRLHEWFGDFSRPSGPVGELFDAFEDLDVRTRWLPDAELSTRTATRPKSARYDWEDGSTRVVSRDSSSRSRASPSRTPRPGSGSPT